MRYHCFTIFFSFSSQKQDLAELVPFLFFLSHICLLLQKYVFLQSILASLCLCQLVTVIIPFGNCIRMRAVELGLWSRSDAREKFTGSMGLGKGLNVTCLGLLLCCRLIYHKCVICFWSSYSVPLIYMSILGSVPYDFDYCCFMVQTEVSIYLLYTQTSC